MLVKGRLIRPAAFGQLKVNTHPLKTKLPVIRIFINHHTTGELEIYGRSKKI
jgi:hypothetical protein